MDKQPEFQVLYENLFHYLQSNGKMIEMSTRLASFQSLDAKFISIYVCIQKYIHFNFKHNDKDEILAEKFRKDGNKLYKDKHLKRALENYNKSICYSPHKYDGNKMISNCLSLGFANRSAILYELENYDACISDIERSINYGYPSLLKPKLIERHAKCLLAQEKKEEAKSKLITYLNEVSELEEEEIALLQKGIENIISLIHKCDYEFDKFKNTEDFLRKYNLFNKPPVIPELLEQNPKIPALSSAASLCYSVEKGRYLVANRDIYPGEIVIKDKSFTSIVLLEYLFSHCSYCLQRTVTPLPCHNCSLVVFCCEDCRNKSNQYHTIECAILPTLIDLDIGENGMLALRLIVQMSLPVLKEKIPIYEEENVYKSGINIGFNEENMYLSDDFRTIYNLVLHNEPINNLFKRGVMSVCLVKLLLKTNYFGDDVKFDDIVFVGKTLIELMMKLSSNAYSIGELSIVSSNCHESYIEEIGAGAFGVLSLMNHSCDPSICRSSYGTTVLGRAIKYIPKGMEITDSYGPMYTMQSMYERQNKLKRRYHFTCSCEACSNNWNTYLYIRDEIFLKCSNCNVEHKNLSDICTKCNVNIAQTFLDGKSVKDVNAQIKLMIKNFNFESKYFDISKKEQFENFEQTLVELIQLLSLYAYLPNRTMIIAQETLKFISDYKGSHHYKHYNV